MKKKEAFKIQEREADTKLVRQILRKRPNLKKQDVFAMMNTYVETPKDKFRVLTSGQLATLTGKRPDAIITMTTLRIRGGEVTSALTRILPFRELDEAGKVKDNTKKTFILIDEKAIKFLTDCNR